MRTNLPLGLGKVLLDLNADRIVDVLAPGRLSDYPGKQMTEQNAYFYFKATLSLLCVPTALHTCFYHKRHHQSVVSIQYNSVSIMSYTVKTIII